MNRPLLFIDRPDSYSVAPLLSLGKGSQLVTRIMSLLQLTGSLSLSLRDIAAMERDKGLELYLGERNLIPDEFSTSDPLLCWEVSSQASFDLG